jgi:Flp pilus assembly pilin Flp
VEVTTRNVSLPPLFLGASGGKEEVLITYIRVQTALQSLKNDNGQGMIEYTLLAALISIVALVVITATGTSVNLKFGTVSAALT